MASWPEVASKVRTPRGRRRWESVLCQGCSPPDAGFAGIGVSRRLSRASPPIGSRWRGDAKGVPEGKVELLDHVKLFDWKDLRCFSNRYRCSISSCQMG